MSNCALNNLPGLDDEKIRSAIYLAEANAVSHIKFDYEEITDATITRLIRMGFSISYNGMFQMYRIAW